MSQNLSFSTRKDRISKLSAIFYRQPELLYKNAYINFLREFRIRHLDLEIPELYHEGAVAWSKLSDKEKKTFRYLDVIKDVKLRRAMKEKLEKLEKKRRRAKSLIARRTIQKNKRKLYPFRTIINRHSQRRSRIDKKKTKTRQKPSKEAERIRQIFESLRNIGKKPTIGRRRQRRSQRRRVRRQRVRRGRQIKRRK
ncbi:uncharacterized protein LOC129912145 [Episyrphus balteatus]|uniref:uncharacterized protein LOC129912145 n=1 Tax=Episyrphus balteatus TaxID=286459 RepID=UPI002486783A|nr:uncharacterized protein LOC129912145 [Episyrphus balteatus]